MAYVILREVLDLIKGQYNRGRFFNGGRGFEPTAGNFCGLSGSSFQGNVVHSYSSFDTAFAYYCFTPGSSTFVLNTTHSSTGQPTTSTSSTLPFSAQIPSPEFVENSFWYIDSRATNHITNDFSKHAHPQAYTGQENLFVENGNALLIKYVGSVLFDTSTS